MMRATILYTFLVSAKFVLADDIQWIPNYYQSSINNNYKILTMFRGSCTVSLNIFKGQHFHVKIPFYNRTIPAGVCAILLNSMENYNIAIALEHGLADTENYLFNQNIRLYTINHGNVTLIQNDCNFLNDFSPLMKITNSSIALLLIKADQSIEFSFSVFPY
ncbi:uncharacterized protein LOC126905280 [Daktulosphaira vitifoliae]|uniref:uncharacterized protein LOC126905280 n=1 Tax=Daktulosphaira vitifoliae TaxID=58002 RepID=UPI0021AAE873|nr:uncharacterized protein LOC126905280 [Daktulosphaira vitifoliae]